MYVWLSLVAATLNVWTVPSPQSTLVDMTEPSGSVEVMETVTNCPELGVVVEGTKLTVGGLSVTEI